MTPTFYNRLWLSALAVTAALIWVLSCLTGCAHTPAQRIALPTAAAVDASIGQPVRAAKASNATAARLAARAEKSGLAAGSADAHALTLSIAQTDQHLSEIVAGKDALVAQLGSVQLQIDALEKHDTAQTALAKAEAVTIRKIDRSLWLWRGLCALSLLLDYFIGALIETRLRGAVAVVHGLLATGYHVAAGFLKSLFPLYLCWLPA